MTILVMVGVRTEAHIFRSQVGIGSESDCLLGQLKRILDISDSEAGLKEEKLEGSVGGEGECGDEERSVQCVCLVVKTRKPCCRKETARCSVFLPTPNDSLIVFTFSL